MIVIATNHPPSPLPLTAADTAVSVVSPPPVIARDAGGHDARPIEVATGYAFRREPADPLTSQFQRWTRPTAKQLNMLVDALRVICNPRRVHILCPFLIVELHVDDQRTYKPGSLPRRIGRFAVFYHRKNVSVFEGLDIKGGKEQYESGSHGQKTFLLTLQLSTNPPRKLVLSLVRPLQLPNLLSFHHGQQEFSPKTKNKQAKIPVLNQSFPTPKHSPPPQSWTKPPSYQKPMKTLKLSPHQPPSPKSNSPNTTNSSINQNPPRPPNIFCALATHPRRLPLLASTGTSGTVLSCRSTAAQNAHHSPHPATWIPLVQDARIPSSRGYHGANTRRICGAPRLFEERFGTDRP